MFERICIEGMLLPCERTKEKRHTKTRDRLEQSETSSNHRGILCAISEVYLELRQTTTMELICKHN